MPKKEAPLNLSNASGFRHSTVLSGGGLQPPPLNKSHILSKTLPPHSRAMMVRRSSVEIPLRSKIPAPPHRPILPARSLGQ